MTSRRSGPFSDSFFRLVVSGSALLLAGAGPAPTTVPTTAPVVTPARISGLAADLEQPVLLTAGGKLMDGHHAAPFFGDIEGKGRKDLLVGQFDDGKLRIYRNVGSNDQPRFEQYTWFKAGAEVGTVPAG